MSEYIIPLDEIESAMGNIGKTIYEAHKWREIVRCRDCIYFATDELGDYCTMFDFEDVSKQKMLNGFCAWGERETINKTGDIVTRDSNKVVGE